MCFAVSDESDFGLIKGAIDLYFFASFIIFAIGRNIYFFDKF